MNLWVALICVLVITLPVAYYLLDKAMNDKLSISRRFWSAMGVVFWGSFVMQTMQHYFWRV